MEHPHQPPALLVIADDLTGANDVGAQFAKRDIPAVVLVEPGFKEFPSGYEVVVVNTESRHVSPQIAAERVRECASRGIAAGVQYFFKKTDSTLRGNIGAELEALLQSTGEKGVVFVPAFPELGRTTRDGAHFVDGVPIAESAFARDPLSPICDNKVADVLRRTANIQVRSVRLPAGPAWQSGVIVMDCESRAELREIARWLARSKGLRVLAGSAAMAEELPSVLELRREQTLPLKPCEPILLVNGSLNPRALDQAASAGPAFRRVKMSADVLLNEKVRANFLQDLTSTTKQNVLLFSAHDRDEYAAYAAKAAELGIPSSEIHLKVANATGEIVRSLLERGDFGTLVVFGGDTLLGVARACGWNALEPRTEVDAGITVSTPLASALTVISKAGGFGDKNVVEAITRWVHERSASR